MSIIYDALNKAVEKRKKNAAQPQDLPILPSIKETLYRQRPEPEVKTREDGIKKAGPLSDNEKAVLRNILFTIGAIFFISIALLIIVRQNINYTVSRSLAREEKYEPLTEPLKTIPRHLSAAAPKSTLPERPEFMLTGIVSDKDSPLAIINGGVYMVGDRVETAKVLEISGNTVVLENKGRRIELKVK